MVITIDSGTYALIYELALIPAIFGLDWIGSGFSGNFMDWIGLGQQNGPMSNSVKSSKN